MKVFKFLSLALVLLLVASCSNVDKKLKKMVPKDAFVVMNFNPKALIEHSGAEISDDGVIENLPKSVKEQMGADAERSFKDICKGIASLGVDTDNRIYFYANQDEIPVVALIPLKNQKDTKEVLEDGISGQKFSFSEEDGMEIAKTGNTGIALKDDIMLVGMIQDAGSFARKAQAKFEADFANISECEGADECLDADNDVNCYVNLSKITGLLTMFAGQLDPQIASIVQLLGDMKAVAASCNLADNMMTFDGKAFMDDKSDLAQLMNSAFTTGDASFLQYVPANADNVMAFNIRGKNIAGFEQVKKLIELMEQDPDIRELKIGQLLASVNGPFFVAADLNSNDPGQYNEIVLGFKTSKAADFVRLVGNLVHKANVPATVSNNIYSFSMLDGKVDAGVKGSDMAYIKYRSQNAEPASRGGIDAQEASKIFAGAITGTYSKTKFGDYTLCGDGCAKDTKKSTGHFYILGKDGEKLPLIQWFDVFMKIGELQQKRYQEMMSRIRDYDTMDNDMAYADEELVEAEVE